MWQVNKNHRHETISTSPCSVTKPRKWAQIEILSDLLKSERHISRTWCCRHKQHAEYHPLQLRHLQLIRACAALYADYITHLCSLYVHTLGVNGAFQTGKWWPVNLRFKHVTDDKNVNSLLSSATKSRPHGKTEARNPACQHPCWHDAGTDAWKPHLWAALGVHSENDRVSDLGSYPNDIA